MSIYFDKILSFVSKPFVYLFDFYFVPFWDFLVEHDRYVYVAMFIVIMVTVLLG